MTKSELKKKRQQIVEQKGYKTYKQRKEEEKQQAKTIQTTNTRPISTPSATNTLNWNNVVNRANQILANTRNANNLVNVKNPLLMKPQDNLISEEQAKSIANIDDSKKRFEAISKLSNNRQQYQKNAMQVNTIRETEKSKKKAEKINEDIAKGNYLSSVGHVLKGLPTEALNATAKTTLSLANLNPNTKNSKEMMEAGKLLTSRYNDTTSQINNKIVQGASRVSGTIGNMLPSIATSMMGGPAGLINAINVGSSSYMENLNEEQDNKVKSLLTGAVKGTLSYNIEKLAGGNFLGKGSLDDLAKEGISKVKSDIGKRIASKLYEVGGEIAEENLENITGYIADKLINNKNITMEQFISDLKQTTGDTAITTLVLSALGLGGDTYNQVKINETIDNSSLSNEQKNALKKVAEENNVSLGEVEALITENNQNQTTTMQNNEILQQEQQTIPNQDKTAQNQMSQEILGNGKYSIKMPNSNYKFNKSGNTKIDNLRQDANKYWNNSKDTQKLMTTLEKIMNDKDVSIRLDDKITDGQGNVVDGRYDNGVITINPNSTRAFEYIATHELTHAIGTKQMLDMVQRYRQDNQEFNSKVETLLKNYNATELTEEALADVSAQLFGTQEFIANVQNTNPNLFQKIYNEIKYLWHQFRGYKNEGQFIEDLYNKWTQAYNSKSELNQTSKNMIAGRIAMNNAISQNAQFKVIEDAYNKALQMDSRKASNEEIRKKTNWFKDKNGHWKFRFTDKDMTLTKDVNHIVANKEYDLDKLIKHDILFELYPELKSSAENPIKVRFKNIKNSSKRGAYSPNTNVITLNTRLLNLKNAQSYIEETLIHEIQHAVQKIEGFEAGTNLKGGIKKYNENLGEIEAYDSENTFYEEKYLGKEVKRAPESSKANPKPLNLKNENIFDTIISSINDFFSKENASYEQSIDIIEEIEKKNNSRNRNMVENGINKNEGLEESSSFNLQKDNQGRTLSKEQQEYFKDSNVRDENGRLLEVYHGTDADFTVFNKDFIGYNGSQYGKGFYYTTKPEQAKLYEKGNGKTLKGYLKIDNPLSITEKTMSLDTFTDLVHKINKQTNGMFYKKLKNNFSLSNTQNTISLEEWQQLVKDFGKENYISTWSDETRADKGTSHIYNINSNDFDVFRSLINSLSREDTQKFIEEVQNRFSDRVNVEENIKELYDSFNYDNEILQRFDKYSAEMKDEYKFDVYKTIEDMGYDGLVSKDMFITFNSSQFKNVDNTNPTDNPDIRYLKENAEWQEYLEEHFNTEGTRTYSSQIRNGLPQESVLRQNVTNSKKYTTKKETDTEIAKVLDTPVTRQKPKDRMWAIMKANILDKGIVFEDLSKRAKNRELEAKWDYTLTSGARAQNAIGNKRYDLSGNVISKGLTEIMDEVGDKINDFQNYMYHQLNVDRMTLKDRLGIDNKPVFGDKIGADYSQRKIAEYEKSNPKFKEWAKDVYDYLKADKAELVKNGVISEELSRKFEELYPHYVPIQRADKLGNAINVPLDTRRTGINTPIKKAKGGSSDINPLFQTMANRTMQTYRASARNSLGVELKNTLQRLNEFKSSESNIADLDSIIETVSNEAQTDELLKASKDGRLPTFTVFQNGEKVTFDISEDIYDALKPTSEALKGMWLKGIPNKISNLRRAVLTEYNPLFSITNTIKDTQDVLLNSQHATKTYLKYPEAYTQILNKGFWYNEYIQNGGGQNTYFKDGDFEVKKTGKLPKAKEIITFPLEAISKVNNALEMAPRLAEYIASREEGRSIQTSMLDASRVTTNFKAGGDFTKALNRNGATFLNAGVQGTMQAVRNIREANQQGLKGWTVLACKLAVAGAPVWILNNLMWEDDEEYEQLQDYVKDGYYIVGKRDDGTFIRIPKGRTLASIQKVVSNVDKYMNNNNELNIDTFAQDFWETLKFGVENVAPNNPIDNNVLSPIAQVLTNTSWYGEDIVPERLQNVPKAEQFDETTDKFSKWLGEKLNVSPMKINYLLDQYGGGISDVLLPLGTPQAENTPLEDKFVTDPVMKSKYPGEFFEKADKIDIASNSMYATDTDIVKGKYMSYIQGNISDLYKEKREIQNSTYSDTAKKEKLKEVQKQINQTAKMAIEDIENAKVTSTTAIIGAEGFYKDSDGEWKRIKEEDRISNLRIQSYSDYKVKKEEATDKKRKEKGNDKATLNDSEIIEIIKNSNYTDKEKDALFDDQINDKTYKNLKLLNKNNISKINQYMDYKTADLDSDKKDDGTKKGKTIYGSKEKKITTYLNNSSFDDVERIYLYGQTYKLDNEQRKKLTNAVKKAGLTSEEQKQIYLDLASSNVEELSDGRIRWK